MSIAFFTGLFGAAGDIAALEAQVNNLPQNATGIDIHNDGKVTLNVDISKLDIVSCIYFIEGIKYIYGGGTAIVPTIEVGDSSTWVGLDSSGGLIYSANNFTDIQLETILPLARLQAVEGQSGSGSDLLSPIDLRYIIGEEGWINRRWLTNVIGALYPADGIDGIITENATDLRLDQTSGIMYSAQRNPITITGDTQILGRALYHIAGVWSLQNSAIIVIPTDYDDGTDLVNLPNNSWASQRIVS